jgi:uncharacterized membrane protein YcaP (DUF421 family)
MNIVLQAILVLLSGILLLKVSGRKSISQMTLPQTVTMLAIGTIIATPVAQKGAGKTILVVGIFVATLLLLEYLQLKINGLERFFTGKSVVVIQDGTLQVAALKKMRMAVDQLEMRLRTSGIEKIEDVKTATIEPNGQLGYELKEDAKPLTLGEFKKLMGMYIQKGSQPQPADGNIFQELQGQSKENPKYLQ